MEMQDTNLDRGLIQKPLPRGGPLISMCKDVPGIYFDASGIVVSEEMAASCGFDVKAHKREAAKAAAMEVQRKRIEAQFKDDTKALDGMSDEDLAEASGTDLDGPAEPAAREGEDDGSPFIERTAGGEPRVARVVAGGPVRVMEYEAKAKKWEVKDRDTGELLADDLDKHEATELLLAEG